MISQPAPTRRMGPPVEPALASVVSLSSARETLRTALRILTNVTAQAAMGMQTTAMRERVQRIHRSANVSLVSSVYEGMHGRCL